MNRFFPVLTAFGLLCALLLLQGCMTGGCSGLTSIRDISVSPPTACLEFSTNNCNGGVLDIRNNCGEDLELGGMKIPAKTPAYSLDVGIKEGGFYSLTRASGNFAVYTPEKEEEMNVKGKLGTKEILVTVVKTGYPFRERCEQKTKGEDKTTCYMQLAVTQNDESLCSKISESYDLYELGDLPGYREMSTSLLIIEDAKTACYSAVAIKKNDTSVCLSAQLNNVSDQCIKNLAYVQENVDFCDLSRTSKDECQYLTCRKILQSVQECRPFYDGTYTINQMSELPIKTLSASENGLPAVCMKENGPLDGVKDNYWKYRLNSTHFSCQPLN